MQIDLTEGGVRLVGAEGRVELGPARPAANLRLGGRERRFEPERFTLRGDTLVSDAGPSGVILELTARHAEDAAAAGTQDEFGTADVTVRLRNDGPSNVRVERLTSLLTHQLRVGEDARRWRTYRNGYQSWAGTRTIGADEADADFPTRLIRLSGTDGKHRSPTDRGHVRSDTLSVVCEPTSGDALGVGFLRLADSFGFVELVAPDGVVDRFEVWSDLDGVELEPGASIEVTHAVVATSDALEDRPRATPAEGDAGRAGWRALKALAFSAAQVMGARTGSAGAVGSTGDSEEPGRHHPGGWCSWYFYFAKVTEADVRENLDVLADDGRNGPVFACEYVMVDDGHQSAIGDWLDTDPGQFPSGMPDLADRITAAGFDAGIWWAPFLVDPRSTVAREHPDWLVRNERGKPIVGILNPIWAPTTPMRVLDTTHPQVIEHLTHVARVIGDEWGYAIQKLDFLYAAALPGVRHDRSATRARSLRRGLDAIRAGVGDRGFLLVCGCPMGPAVGVVDAMRIGADVTPYWSNAIDRVAGRGRHGLSTRNAVVNVLTRSVLDGVWFLNDPDCLMVRDTDTKLTEEEVRVLATVMGLTDGMLVISDRLERVGAARRGLIRRTAELTGGHVEVLDLFERELPELVVSRRGGEVLVGVLNLADHSRRVTVDLRGRGLPDKDGVISELWTGAPVRIAGGLADLGRMPQHSARILVLESERTG